jgi:hypothetical protein
VSRRAWAAGVLIVVAGLTGCGTSNGPGARAAIQERYDAIGRAVADGDGARVRALWTADSAGAGSPLAALGRAAAAGARLTAWSGGVHRFRMVGDTAVVDVSVRAQVDGLTGGTVTSQVVRGFWVRAPEDWTLVRSEALGGAHEEASSR